MFERAVDRDPGYSQAHAWLACGLGQAMAYRPQEYAALLDQAEAAAQRGLELDACDSECLRILAQIAMLRRNLELAVRHQERGLFLNPNDDRSVCAMGEFLSFWGRSEEAEGWIRKAMKLNPYHPPRYWSHLARVLFHLGRHEEALEALKNIRAPRVRERAFQVAASYALGKPAAIEKSVTTLRSTRPDFDPERFVSALPYDADADRQALLDALSGALGSS
jgi:adenylate cyclase